ncbi:MAG: DUF2207 domain-containing protein, partial [Gammaproteobacteria bacterium]|nr:DUF2207 domain-containing protein [Gammaproteobacteria bacterium]
MINIRRECRLIVRLWATWLVFGVWLPVQADERILSFESDITVHSDGNMVVHETIRVRAEGKSIKRGIYRDFPTRYRDRYGRNYVVDFQLLTVDRNGLPDAHHIENRSNGVRIYIGSADNFINPDVYTYSIGYITSRQLGFFSDHDELYWNVTGNDWT